VYAYLPRHIRPGDVSKSDKALEVVLQPYPDRLVIVFEPSFEANFELSASRKSSLRIVFV
jgi:hypothetical protein